MELQWVPQVEKLFKYRQLFNFWMNLCAPKFCLALVGQTDDNARLLR